MIALKLNDTLIELDEQFDGVRDPDGRWTAKIQAGDERYWAVVDLIYLGVAHDEIADDE